MNFEGIDVSELAEAMRLYAKATRKDAADIANRAAMNACIGGRGLKGALQLTKNASAAGINRFDPEKTGKSKTTKARARLHYALQAKRGVKKGSGIRQKAVSSHKRRLSAVSYSKAIWIAIARKFGARLNAKIQVEGISAKMATERNPVAEFESNEIEVSHISKVMGEALQEGVRNAARDMRDYALKKMQERAGEFSGK